jgi:hypothetical protein
MFDDLTLAELQALRTRLREALVNLVAGEKVADIKYGEMGRKMHPTTPAAARELLSEVQVAIDRLEGRRTGAIFPVGG